MCPACGSDNYMTEDATVLGDPDYESLKTCEECGEAWM